jgi:hypothetical protein
MINNLNTAINSILKPKKEADKASLYSICQYQL